MKIKTVQALPKSLHRNTPFLRYAPKFGYDNVSPLPCHQKLGANQKALWVIAQTPFIVISSVVFLHSSIGSRESQGFSYGGN